MWQEEPAWVPDLQSLPAQESRPQILSVLWVIKDPSTSSSPKWPPSQEDAECPLTPICLPSYSLRFPVPSVHLPFPPRRGCRGRSWV